MERLVALVGLDGSLHAKGYLPVSTLAEVDTLERNGRHYRFFTCEAGTGIIFFIEAGACTHVVTEF